MGTGSPVPGSTGDRAGDQRGHKVLYGGKAAQYWPLIIGTKIKKKTKIPKII
jgi:hypothetical protein